VHGVLSGLDAVNKLFGIAPVCSCNGIGPKNNLESFGGQGMLEHLLDKRQDLLHLGESFLGIGADSQELGLVVEIVVNHQPHLGIEERIVFGHGPQIVIGGISAVFNL